MELNYNKLMRNIDSLIAFEQEGLVRSLLSDKSGSLGHINQVRVFKNLKAVLKRSTESRATRDKIQTILIKNHTEYGEFDYEKATGEIMEVL